MIGSSANCKIPPFIQSRSGQYINLLEPDSDRFLIEDIAHGLSHICRFGGHSREFYSVAQHSVLTSYLVPKEDQFAALMHDAAESYIGDIPKPLKELLLDYQVIERRMEIALFRKFGVQFPLPKSVKVADLVMLATERRDLMPADNLDGYPIISGIAPASFQIFPESPEKAKRRFLERFEHLSSRLVALC